jgi:predicted nucleotidyltransferase
MADTIEQARTKASSESEQRHALIAKLRAHESEIREHGVVALAIFGSRARGEEHGESDLDVLVTYNERAFTLYELVRVERLLQDLTGFKVHVSTPDGFRPQRLSRVLKDAVSVF